MSKILEDKIENMWLAGKFSPDWVFIDSIIKQQNAETEDSHQQRVKRWHRPETKTTINSQQIHSWMNMRNNNRERFLLEEHLFFGSSLKLL